MKTERTFLLGALRQPVFDLALFFVLFLPAIALAQQGIRGRLVNGTTGLPASHQKVELLSVGQGMRVEHETVSAADGAFLFPSVEMGQAPHLIIRVIYQGVNYNLSVTAPEEMNSLKTLTVYETTGDLKNIKVSLPVMLAQASGNALLVQQQYFVNNETNPQRTLANPEGTFRFDTPPPDLVKELSVSVVGLAGIPLPQTPQTSTEGGYSINYPMKPGLNEIRVAYRMDFPSSERVFSHRLFSATGTSRVLILPASLEVSGEGVKPAGTDAQTQAAMYQVSNQVAGRLLKLRIAGPAPEVTDASEEATDPGDDNSGTRVVRLPNRVFQSKEAVIGGFGALFIAVLFLALRQRGNRDRG